MHFMKYTALSGNDKLLRLVSYAVFQKGRRTTHFVGHFYHWAFALWVRQNLGTGVFGLKFKYLFHRKFLVYVACAIPKQHVSPGQAIDIAPKFSSGPKIIGVSSGKDSTIWRALLLVTTTSVTALVAAVVLT